MAVEQIHETMVVLRNKYRDTRPVTGQRNTPLDGKFFRDRLELPRKFLHFQLKAVEVPFDAGQIEAFLARLVLFEMKDISPVAVYEFRDVGVQTFAIRALNQQNGRVSQVLPPLPPST